MSVKPCLFKYSINVCAGGGLCSIDFSTYAVVREDCEAYSGDDYLPLVKGAVLVPCAGPTGVPSHGWAFGVVVYSPEPVTIGAGWYPPSYTRCARSTDDILPKVGQPDC